MIGGAKSGFEKEPARTDQKLAEQVQSAVQADRLFAVKLKIDFKVVL